MKMSIARSTTATVYLCKERNEVLQHHYNLAYAWQPGVAEVYVVFLHELDGVTITCRTALL